MTRAGRVASGVAGLALGLLCALSAPAALAADGAGSAAEKEALDLFRAREQARSWQVLPPYRVPPAQARFTLYGLGYRLDESQWWLQHPKGAIPPPITPPCQPPYVCPPPSCYGCPPGPWPYPPR